MAAETRPRRPTSSRPFAIVIMGSGATASSMDRTVKLWDVRNGRPQLLASRDLAVGKVFSAAFCAAAPHLLAAGGSKGTVTVWDVLADDAVARAFGAMLMPGRPRDE